MDSVDARYLWEDALTLLKETDIPQATIVMFGTCSVESLVNQTLTIAVSSRFAQRQMEKYLDEVEKCLERIAFEPISLNIITQTATTPTPVISSTISNNEYQSLSENKQAKTESILTSQTAASCLLSVEERKRKNPLVEHYNTGESSLTFDQFVAGDENSLALNAAREVANGDGINKYNPLFIFGKSGVGKTHLLKAIQNYIDLNDPNRLCVYKVANEFINDYVVAMNGSDDTRMTLAQNYHDIDVLIIDDIQQMRKASGSLSFFFDTFNYLRDHGKQIVIAADRTPLELGMGSEGMDERITSRLSSGFEIGIQIPTYELKLNLINTFITRMQAELSETSSAETVPAFLTQENKELMASLSGSNIRMIQGFCQSCVIAAQEKEKKGKPFTDVDIKHIASQKWPLNQKRVTIEDIQNTVETYYNCAHSDLIGNKRNKEIMEPRHVAIFLAREITDNTLADIGKRFGDRTHATIKHSLKWVQEQKKIDRLFSQRVNDIQDSLME